MSRTCGFRSIMVPVDGSRFAEAAIPYALAVAERAHCKVRFVLVHPDPYPPLMIEPARVYLNELTQRFGGRLGGSLSSIILNGPVAPSLVKHAQEIGADLVVMMTTHGLGGLRRAWLGSVADELIRTIEVPVLVTRPREDGSVHSLDLREILVTLDGSLLAEVALGPAVALAKLWDAEISFVQVVSPELAPAYSALPYPVRFDEELTRIRTESAQAYLREVVERVRLTGAKASGVAVVGTSGVAQTLLELAKPERISLITMATHGRGGVPRLVLGSVTNKIVRAAGLPVLVVPHSYTARQTAKVQREMIKSAGAGEELARVGPPS
jgi:nucleotide-binding universal stress UspA family protein